jgi:hypothetical protein
MSTSQRNQNLAIAVALGGGALLVAAAIACHKRRGAAAGRSGSQPATAATAGSAKPGAMPPLPAGSADVSLGDLRPPASTAGVGSIFKITTANGFLPLVQALRKLPDGWTDLDDVRARSASVAA